MNLTDLVLAFILLLSIGIKHLNTTDLNFIVETVFDFKALLIPLLTLGLCHAALFGQSDFDVIMKSDRKVGSLGAGQQLTEKWPIPELKKRFKTIIVTAKHLESMDVDQFIEDMNQNPRLTMLTINTSGRKDLVDEDLQSIPLHKLKYVKHLAYKRYGMSGMELSSIIDWAEVLQMNTLEYLYLQPSKRFERQGGEVNVPENVAERLASQLIGYVNLGYSGEFDSVDNQFECLGINVDAKQENQPLEVLNRCLSLKKLHLSVDTFSQQSLEDLFSMDRLEDLKIGTIMKFGMEYQQLHDINLRLPSLRYLNCSSTDLVLFQSIASQLSGLEIKRTDLQTKKIETFLSSAIELNELKLNLQRDTLIRFQLNPNMPLTKLELSGKLVELPDELCQFKGLETLNLKYNRIRLLPNCISELKELKYVDLSNNHLEEQPPFWEWRKLEYLNLDRNYLKEISDRWENNSSLKFLKLNSNPFSNKMESLAECKNLEELWLVKTCITSLPEKINQLENLTQLRVEKSAFTSFDKNYEFECNTTLDSLPAALSQLKKLERISVKGQKNLNSSDLEILLNSESESLEIDFSKVDLDYLPAGDWQNPGIKKLNLGSNHIKHYPASLLENSIPELNLRGNKLGVLNQRITTETERLIWQFSAGLDVVDELKAQPDVMDAVIEVANKFYARPDENPVLDLMPIMLSIDTLEVLSKVKANNYGDALFEVGRYDEAEKYLSLAIKKQKEGCFIFVNGISSLYLKRHQCYLEMQDTISAIADLRTIQTDYGFFMGYDLFKLHLATGNLSKVEELKGSVIEKYKSLKPSNENLGTLLAELSILEIYLVTNDTKSFEEQSNLVKTFEAQEYTPVFEYLKLVKRIQEESNLDVSIAQFKTDLEEQNFKNEKWGCDLVKYWSKQLDTDKRVQIQALNSLICPE